MLGFCRKKKAVHKVSTTDDKRLQATLKRLGVNTIPGIEEVNLFVENDVIHFTNPKGVRQHCPASVCAVIEHRHHCLTRSCSQALSMFCVPRSASIHCRQHLCGQRPFSNEK